MADEAPILRLEEVVKVYGRGDTAFTALHGIDLTVQRGEFVAIVGQSGSGKSTLLNIIGTLDRPTRGRMWLDGHDVSELDDDRLTRLRGRTIGFVFQFHYLLPDFTVLENVLMPSAIQRSVPTRAQVEEALGLLRRVGVESQAKKLVTQISGGQQQRVAIARALQGGKPLILADEPTGNLDSVNGREAFALMREFNRRDGTTFMIVTHDEQIAEQCDRIVRITDGRIEEDRRQGQYVSSV